MSRRRGGAAMSGREILLRITRVLGAVIGYGCLVAFLCLISLQLYRWFREGEWTHIGMSDGLRTVLAHCCLQDGDAGRLAALSRWLEAPVDWLGLHKVLEVIPASLALFALSIVGNSIFIYCRDRIEEYAGAAARERLIQRRGLCRQGGRCFARPQVRHAVCGRPIPARIAVVAPRQIRDGS